MAQETSVPFTEKMDGSLVDLCSGRRGLMPSSRLAILVRYEGDALTQVTELVRSLGGSIRHQLAFMSALAAWVPLSALEGLAKSDAVQHLEFEQSFTIA